MSRNRRKPIGPGTTATYLMVLKRAYGTEVPPFAEPVQDLTAWPVSSLKILHAAVLKYAPERIDDIPDEEWAPSRVIQAPTEAEITRFEVQAEGLEAIRRAIVLLPLNLGLRASELLTLTRSSVERAVEGEELLVFRKGGREHLLPADNLRPLLQDLLADKEWEHLWQLLSATSERAAYRALHRQVQDLGLKAGVKGLRPHKLRHGFATRMMRDGASLPFIQAMLDHKSPETTTRYVHVEHREIVKFLRSPKGKA